MLTEVRLQKLAELIRSLKMGRDALLQEGRVDQARVIDAKITEIQHGYDIVARQVQTDRQLKELTKQAKDVERTYIEGVPPSISMSHPIGVPPPAGIFPTAREKAKVRKHKRRRRGKGK